MHQCFACIHTNDDLPALLAHVLEHFNLSEASHHKCLLHLDHYPPCALYKPDRLQCGSCLFTFPTLSLFLKHWFIHLPMTQREAVVTQRLLAHKTAGAHCEQCGRDYMNGHRLRTHMAKMHPYQCPSCTLAVASSAMLKTHVRLRHQQPVPILPVEGGEVEEAEDTVFEAIIVEYL